MSENKAALLAAIVARLEEELAVILAGAASSHQEATDTENRQEGKYDMRAQMAAYLAAGQAKVAAELNEAIAAYRSLPSGALPAGAAAGVGALVAIESQGQSDWFFLGPARGGLEVPFGNESVTVVTPGSPLGRQLLGRHVGAVLSPGRTLTKIG